jgi:D-tyrosyl-tRNA(Tyr) deacylase
VSSASVVVDEATVGAIERGLLVLVGIAEGDTVETVRWMADKIVRLRIFDDDQGKFDRSLLDVGGALLSVSQFTLLGDARKGTRPSFTAAARPELAQELWHLFNESVAAHGVSVRTGTFAAHMHVSLVNDGPVTLTLER